MDKGEIRTYCYMVQTGKPAALIPFQERHVDAAVVFVTVELGLSTYIEKLAEGWVSFWIYKYPHILEVIKSTPQAPKTAFDHWVLGKLFGYEEAAIQEFLSVTHVQSLSCDILGRAATCHRDHQE